MHNKNIEVFYFILIILYFF